MKTITSKNFLRALPLLAVFFCQFGLGQQVGNLRIFVSGTELGPTSQAEQRGTKTFIPVAPVAERLGYLIQIDAQQQRIIVQRNGTTSEFIKLSSEIRENGTTVSVVPDTTDIIFGTVIESLKLPIEVISPLLNVSIFTELDQGVVRIEQRDSITSKTITQKKRWGVNIFDYNYDGSFSNGYSFQNIFFNTAGNIGSNIFEATANFTSQSLQLRPSLRNGNFTLQRRRGDRFQVGDLRRLTASELILSNALIRGFSYENSFSSQRIGYAIYGGRSVGSEILTAENLRDFSRRRFNNLNFNTNFFGARATYRPNKLLPNQAIRNSNLTFSSGVAIFSNREFKGQMLDTAVRYRTKDLNLEAEVAAGNFSSTPEVINGFNLRGFKGFGTGVVFRGSYAPWSFLSVQGYYDKYSPNFSSPVRDGGYNNRESRSIGVNVRPFDRLSFGGSVSYNQNRQLRNLNSVVKSTSYSLNLAYDPSLLYLPRISVTTTQTKNSLFGNISLLVANLSREYGRFRPTFNLISTKIKDQTAYSLGFGTNIDAGSKGNFQAQTFFALTKSKFLRNSNLCSFPEEQLILGSCIIDYNTSLQLSGSSASLDWTPRNLLFNKYQISLGGGYLKDQEKIYPLVRASVGFPIFNDQQVRVGYIKNGFDHEFRISLSGSLAFWKSKKVRNDAAIVEEKFSETATVQGRAYLDENFDHKFEEGVDTPLNNIRILMDNGRVAVSDSKGIYKFTDVTAGEHSLEISFEDIRANLVPAEGIRQKINVSPLTTIDTFFRLVKSGSITGRVWFDQNNDGEFNENEGLANIRVVSGSGSDTFTDRDGTFLLSDLPPGQQTIFIDRRYLSEDMDSANSTLSVEVVSGQVTKDVNFIFKTKEREVKIVSFEQKPQ